MEKDFLSLPRPDYRLGRFYQWTLPRDSFPFEDLQFQLDLFPHICWQSREGGETEFHWGAISSMSEEQKLDLIENCRGTVLFDWRSFFGDVKGDEWKSFFQFSLPLLPEVSLFSDRVVLRHFGEEITKWRIPRAHFERKNALSSTPEEIYAPGYDQWEELVHCIQNEFKETSLEKVVLSRKKVRSFSSFIDHETFWKKLQSFRDPTYRLMIRSGPQTCFYSLSPERLFKRRGRHCQTEAVAGTLKNRSSSQRERGGEGEKMGSFKGNQKESYEHEIVVQGIIEDMKRLSEKHSFGETEVIDLHHIQHLKTPLSFTLSEGIPTRDIRDALHPTAALGGSPKGQAVEFIQTHEPFDRGLFGGPLGRWAKDEAEYVVGIRSALIFGGELHVFAGAGIVPQSQAMSEWRETENKMEYFL